MELIKLTYHTEASQMPSLLFIYLPLVVVRETSFSFTVVIIRINRNKTRFIKKKKNCNIHVV